MLARSGVRVRVLFMNKMVARVGLRVGGAGSGTGTGMQ